MARSTHSSFHTLSAVNLISRSLGERQGSNSRLLGERREHYLCAMPQLLRTLCFSWQCSGLNFFADSKRCPSDRLLLDHQVLGARHHHHLGVRVARIWKDGELDQLVRQHLGLARELRAGLLFGENFNLISLAPISELAQGRNWALVKLISHFCSSSISSSKLTIGLDSLSLSLIQKNWMQVKIVCPFPYSYSLSLSLPLSLL